jgi:hypothetical protein
LLVKTVFNLNTNTVVVLSEQPLLKELQQLPMQLDVSKSIRNASVKLLDAFVDSLFQFADQPVLPSQVINPRDVP